MDHDRRTTRAPPRHGCVVIPRETWLITGASGFLAANLGWWLGSNLGPAVHRIGVSRGKPNRAHFETHISVDLATDPSQIDSLIREIQPSVVVNAAAIASHQRCEDERQLAARVNRDAVTYIAHACAGIGSRLIHISTDAVFDGSSGGYTEESDPSPFGVYGETKLAGELAALEAYAEALVVRTNFFGWSPDGSRSILEFFVNTLATQTTVRGFTDFTTSSIYVQHLSALLVELARVDHAGVLHVASRDSMTKYEFGRAVASEFSLNGDLIQPISGSRGPDGLSRARDLSLDTDLLTRILGRQAPSQTEGIRSAAQDAALRAAIRQAG